jgi:hypothetical protein
MLGFFFFFRTALRVDETKGPRKNEKNWKRKWGTNKTRERKREQKSIRN